MKLKFVGDGFLIEDKGKLDDVDAFVGLETAGARINLARNQGLYEIRGLVNLISVSQDPSVTIPKVGQRWSTVTTIAHFCLQPPVV